MAKFAVTLVGKPDGSAPGVNDTEVFEASSRDVALVVAGMDMLRALLMDNPANTFRMEQIIDDMTGNFDVTVREL